MTKEELGYYNIIIIKLLLLLLFISSFVRSFIFVLP